MLDDFWRVYDNHVFLYHFYECHLDFNRTIVSTINGASILLTVFALTLFSYNVVPFICAVIILLGQIVASFRDAWDLTRKTWSLRYYQRDSKRLLQQMREDWRLINRGETPGSEISSKAFLYDSEINAIREKYLDELSFSEKPEFVERALKKTAAYFKFWHPSEEVSHRQSQE